MAETGKFANLHSVSGFRYCEALIAPAERVVWRAILALEQTEEKLDVLLREIQRRAETAVEIAEENRWLLALAGNSVTIGRARLYASVMARGLSTEVDQETKGYFTRALEWARESGRLDELPRILLHCAHGLQFSQEELSKEAVEAIDEAERIAEQGTMPLYLADVHLHRARFYQDGSELAKARELIKEHGYWRRRKELEDAEQASESW